MGLFRKKLKQEHKIMLQAERAQGALLPEYHRATPECPHPERWSMYDSMTAEAEVLEFLRTLVTTIKPNSWSRPEHFSASARSGLPKD